MSTCQGVAHSVVCWLCISLYLQDIVQWQRLLGLSELAFKLLLWCLVSYPQELVEHKFWQTKLPLLELPPEPALEEFIRLHKLAPSGAVPASQVSKSTTLGCAFSVSVGLASSLHIRLMQLRRRRTEYADMSCCASAQFHLVFAPLAGLTSASVFASTTGCPVPT